MPAFNIIVGADGSLECGPVGGSPRAVDPGIVNILCELLQRLRSLSLEHGLNLFFRQERKRHHLFNV